MLGDMNKLIALVACAVVALPATAGAAPVKYAGKTSSGHKLTFKAGPRQEGGQLRHRRARNVHPDPGRRPELRGAEPWVYTFEIGGTQEWQSKIKPAFYYNEVTANFRVTSKKLRNGTIKGHLR